MPIFRLLPCLDIYQPIEEYDSSWLDRVEIRPRKHSDSKHASTNRIKREYTNTNRTNLIGILNSFGFDLLAMFLSKDKKV
ncbi:hypothetical protein ERJ70_09485 [Sediminibacillus dalangtanensis]|uniref:Uncharacterized protein n=1 Tax=Sediminibacillus dalangtanensis TaxID=2729421 RepID=A0ABX7VRG7_9BACI|nr:hypothetical protein [Sediminibacillus dalangtanensis]QTM99514.1 hypothetical protein ERJ70_09485 [Sediminibacillus dalangtanensis]